MVDMVDTVEVDMVDTVVDTVEVDMVDTVDTKAFK